MFNEFMKWGIRLAFLAMAIWVITTTLSVIFGFFQD